MEELNTEYMRGNGSGSGDGNGSGRGYAK